MHRQPLKRWLAPGSLATFHLAGCGERHVSVPARCGLFRLVCLAVLPALLEAVPASAQVQPLGDELQVNTYTSGSQGRPAVGADGASGFVVVWHSYTPGVSVQAQRYSSAGMAVGDEFRVNTSLSGNYPKVGPDGGGGFVVVWMGGSSGTDTSGSSIQAQRYSSAGMALSTEFQVNTYTTGEQRMPAVSPDGGGGFVVVWRNHYSQGVGGNIQAQRYSSAGVAMSTEFQVNTLTPDYFTTPAIGSDGASGFVVAWESYGSAGTDSFVSIQARRFDSAGVSQGAQFQVNTTTIGYQNSPAIGPDGGGGFVVAWSGADDSYSYGVIQAQRYSSAGMAVGDQFQVNTYTTGGVFRPAVGPDGNGGFVVVWGSGGSIGGDENGSSIQAQQFSSGGVPLGAQFQVNTTTAGYQSGGSGYRGHAIGPDGDGGFVAVWDSDSSAGTDSDSSSIQAQRFGPAAPTMTETPLATASATATATPSDTATSTSTQTPPATATDTATATTTSTPSASSTPATTRTSTPAATPATTSTPSASPVATETRTASATASATPTSPTAILPHASPGTRAALVLSLLALGLAALGMRRREEAEAGHRGGPA